MSGRVLLKGATGFVGSAFWRCLAAAGAPPEILTADNAELLDPNGVDLLIDCAGNSKKYLADRDPEFDRRKNVDEVVATLDRFRPQRCIFISSSAVYADPTTVDSTSEVDEPHGSVSTYGEHKRLGEQAVRRRVARPLILRPAGFIGPGLSKGPVYDLLENNRPWVAADSQMQLLDVDLMAALALKLAATGGTYNAVPPEPTTLSRALPQEDAAQRSRWPDCEGLPRLMFDLDSRRFTEEAQRNEFIGQNIQEFAESYRRSEAKSGVPVLALAGGQGLRLGGALPKPAMMLAGRPLVFHCLRPFLDAGYTQFGLLLGHGAEEVAQAVDRQRELGSVRHFIEATPLGTGGALINALAELDCDSAIVLNADTLFTDFDPEALVKRHVRMGADVTLLAASVVNAAAFGTLDVAPDGRLWAFREKAQNAAGIVYAGAAVVRLEALLSQFRDAGACSLERDIFARLADLRRVHVCVPPRLQFIDAGTPEGWAAAARHVGEQTPCSL